MATKSANLYARIEPDVKEKAESILSTLLHLVSLLPVLSICFINRLSYREDFRLK